MLGLPSAVEHITNFRPTAVGVKAIVYEGLGSVARRHGLLMDKMPGQTALLDLRITDIHRPTVSRTQGWAMSTFVFLTDDLQNHSGDDDTLYDMTFNTVPAVGDLISIEDSEANARRYLVTKREFCVKFHNDVQVAGDIVGLEVKEHLETGTKKFGWTAKAVG